SPPPQSACREPPSSASFRAPAACAVGRMRQPISRVRMQRVRPWCASFIISTRDRSKPIVTSSSGARQTPRHLMRWPSAYARGLAALAVVGEDRLDLGEEVQPLLRHLALTDAGGLAAAEGQLRLAADRRLVDVDHSHLDLLDEAQRRVDVL